MTTPARGPVAFRTGRFPAIDICSPRDHPHCDSGRCRKYTAWRKLTATRRSPQASRACNSAGRPSRPAAGVDGPGRLDRGTGYRWHNERTKRQLLNSSGRLGRPVYARAATINCTEGRRRPLTDRAQRPRSTATNRLIRGAQQKKFGAPVTGRECPSNTVGMTSKGCGGRRQ